MRKKNPEPWRYIESVLKDRDAHYRTFLSDELDTWRDCQIYRLIGGAHEVRAGATIAEFNMHKLRQEMSPEHFKLFAAIYSELQIQASMATHAEPIVRAALRGWSGAKKGGKTPRARDKELEIISVWEGLGRPDRKAKVIAGQAHCTPQHVNDVLRPLKRKLKPPEFQ